MEDIISQAWTSLYTNNPKIQALAVLKNGQIIWQTTNWNLVPFAETLANSIKDHPEQIIIDRVVYTRVYSDEFSIVASSEQGHLLLSAIDESSWLVAWAIPDAIPEFAEIDLAKTALQLRDHL